MNVKFTYVIRYLIVIFLDSSRFIIIVTRSFSLLNSRVDLNVSISSILFPCLKPLNIYYMECKPFLFWNHWSLTQNSFHFHGLFWEFFLTLINELLLWLNIWKVFLWIFLKQLIVVSNVRVCTFPLWTTLIFFLNLPKNLGYLISILFIAWIFTVNAICKQQLKYIIANKYQWFLDTFLVSILYSLENAQVQF